MCAELAIYTSLIVGDVYMTNDLVKRCILQLSTRLWVHK